MATWGLHMRIAEKIINMDYTLDNEYFLVGNIGADCGMPNEDWSQFTPHTDISHWSTGGKGGINPDKFYDTNLKNKDLDLKEYSFLLGYYVHLLSDIQFHKMVIDMKENNIDYRPWMSNPKFIWTIKKDWYDLDHKYFRDYPNNLFHKSFQFVKNFPDYMDYYPKGAIQRQVDYITKFYMNPPKDLDREYVYLSEKQMDEFIENAVQSIVMAMDSKLWKEANESYDII